MTDTSSTTQKKMTLVVASGDFDKLFSALILGTGSLSMGLEVDIFFTFFGLQRLIKGGLEKGPLSRMNFLGLGKWMMKKKMKKAGTASLTELMDIYREFGGHIIACDMTMAVMGITKDKLDETLIDEYGAVGTWVDSAKKADITLFI